MKPFYALLLNGAKKYTSKFARVERWLLNESEVCKFELSNLQAMYDELGCRQETFARTWVLRDNP